MRRSGAVAGLVVVLTLCAAAVATDTSRPVLALTAGERGTRVVALDPATLTQRGTGPAVPDWAFGVEWARSPDASMTALVPKHSERDERLFVIATSGRLRLVSRVSLAGEDVCRLTWPSARRLLLVVTRGGACYGTFERARLLVVDPVTGRIRSQRHLLERAVIVATARARGGLALLVGDTQPLRADRLIVVTASITRSIPLPASRAPALPLDKAAGSSIGLAVDATGRRAYVVEPSGRITDVDIEGGTARTRAVALLRPAAVMKGPGRSVVQVVPLGSGLLAVTGVRRSAARALSPIGLVLVDTRSWRTRTVDTQASRIAYARGTILAYGSSTGAGDAGIGLRAYTSAGVALFDVLRGEPVERVRTQGAYAYVAAPAGGAIVDLRAGSVRPSPPGLNVPYALLTGADGGY